VISKVEATDKTIIVKISKNLGFVIITEVSDVQWVTCMIII